MSDADLREVERELSVNPISLELRRRQARLLQRGGDEEGALRALDLAWRLGACDLEEELSAALEERAIKLETLELRYIPGGLFVMGIGDFDLDAAPPHLVSLQAFWISRQVLTYDAMRGYAGPDLWFRSLAASLKEPGNYLLKRQFAGTWERIETLLVHLNQRCLPQGVAGSYLAPSEAQWERATRAALLRADGRNPYGLEPDEGPQWTRDHYAPHYYQDSPGYDPQGPPAGRDRVIRGVSEVPPAHYAIYREAADDEGTIRVGGTFGAGRALQIEGGLRSRVVFECR